MSQSYLGIRGRRPPEADLPTATVGEPFRLDCRSAYQGESGHGVVAAKTGTDLRNLGCISNGAAETAESGMSKHRLGRGTVQYGPIPTQPRPLSPQTIEGGPKPRQTRCRPDRSHEISGKGHFRPAWYHFGSPPQPAELTIET